MNYLVIDDDDDLSKSQDESSFEGCSAKTFNGHTAWYMLALNCFEAVRKQRKDEHCALSGSNLCAVDAFVPL